MEKVLVVVDMQNDFVDGVLGTPEAKEIVPKVAKKIEEWDGDIVFTQDTHDEDYLDTEEGKKIPVHCIIGTHGWQFVDELRGYTHVKRASIFAKTHFADSDIPAFVHDKYDKIEVVGLCTNICVIMNVMSLKAYLPDAEIVVDASCCAGTTPEMHQKALDVMESCLIDIVNRK